MKRSTAASVYYFWDTGHGNHYIHPRTQITKLGPIFEYFGCNIEEAVKEFEMFIGGKFSVKHTIRVDSHLWYSPGESLFYGPERINMKVFSGFDGLSKTRIKWEHKWWSGYVKVCKWYLAVRG